MKRSYKTLDCICQECKEWSSTKVEDMGIGPYEFWGARGNDSQPEVVSKCCDATCLDESGNEITMSDLEEDYPDPPERDEP